MGLSAKGVREDRCTTRRSTARIITSTVKASNGHVFGGSVSVNVRTARLTGELLSYRVAGLMSWQKGEQGLLAPWHVRARPPFDTNAELR